ncbi:Vacuolar iron transporter cccA [Penicillium chermesinum]|nr:Vacuolar iron transporter cccA [Penicillium chermesinum]
MSVTSASSFMSDYTRVADRDSSVDDEKSLHARLNTDVESGDSKTGEKKSSRFSIDGRTVSDAIIGLSDGMTVPFALTAGLSALGDTKVVVFGGMAELIAGAISMGLGGYLGAKSEEADVDRPRIGKGHNCGDLRAVRAPLRAGLPVDPPPLRLPELPSFLMNFHHTLPEPSGSRAVICAITIALGYFIGGFVPLLPYFFVGPTDAYLALKWSIATMAVALFIFGYGKTCFVSGWKGRRNIRKGVVGGLQMVLVGGVAAGSAMGLVKGFQLLAGNDHA